MRGERGVEHLTDARRRRRLPRPITCVRPLRPSQNYRPAAAAPVASGPWMRLAAAVVAFSVASSVTPGPNNVLLWASGTAFRITRTVRPTW